jgi:hypothetical protein
MAITKTNFTDTISATEYIVRYVYGCYSVQTYLNELVLDTGEVIRNMPIHKYSVVRDIEDRCNVTLDNLEFRDGDKYGFIAINRFNNVVLSRNTVLGVVASINIDVTLDNTPPVESAIGGDLVGGKTYPIKADYGECESPKRCY